MYCIKHELFTKQIMLGSLPSGRRVQSSSVVLTSSYIGTPYENKMRGWSLSNRYGALFMVRPARRASSRRRDDDVYECSR